MSRTNPITLFLAYGKKIVSRLFTKLKPYQQHYFFYLNSKSLKTMSSTQALHGFDNLSNLDFIKILLRICQQVKGVFHDNCLGDTTCARRPKVDVPNSKKFVFYQILLTLVFISSYHEIAPARFICGVIYGFNTLINCHASHLCGNSMCLNPNHLWVELPDSNYERDICHKNGWTSDESCSHLPPCLSSKCF